MHAHLVHAACQDADLHQAFDSVAFGSEGDVNVLLLNVSTPDSCPLLL